MTKKLKNQWIKALLSGDYIQGQESLWNRTENTYCCLGVLGKICGVTGLSGDLQFQYLDPMNKNLRGLKNVPEELRSVGGIAKTLAKINDSGSYTFEQIAEYIKENL